MKSPGVYLLNSTKGITLFEIIITIVIFSLLIGFLSPLAFDFYYQREFDVYFKGIVQSLRRAQLKSIAGEWNSPFGVYFGINHYTLFKGESYASRDTDFDEFFKLPADFSVTGTSEIVFSRIKGFPSDTGNIVLTLGKRSVTITINEVGIIDY